MEFLVDGDAPGRPTLLLAHGAGTAMDSDFMARLAALLASEGLRVVRFEFGYMAQRRAGGSKRPPPKVELLQEEYRAAIEALACDGPLFIGGKSMGGRIASLIADDLFASGRIAGLVCLGYPFHPTGKPETLRTEHLAALRTPALICQGTRDPFGTCEEMAGYALSESIALHWLEDGDHDLKPRKSVSGLNHDDNLTGAAMAVSDWVARTR
ncbi:alpha/beta fold hydrolase [Yangia mangrovi]|uniref:Alpha/beta fold hydrolase n=2 Tax=Alloyangia mangrovi TaxID=1779329 RepID=A0ABT2KJS5_9RHOB|nr:alpha/beta fold hydrolase [Alloyangia mangrovi]MCT4370608.1 alpha/beta fold hydrolase [Alloyangia mangrovi]